MTLATTGKKAHGISTERNLTFNGGTTVIVATGNKSDGIHIDGTLTLSRGTVSIQAYDQCAKYATIIDSGNILTCL